jgi:hypothetical protein
VQKTIQIKLLPDARQSEVFLATMQNFNAECDWLSERAIQLEIFTSFGLQTACYKSIRLLFGLSAQSTCLVCRKVADAFTNSKTPRTFRSLGAITYDLRLLSWNLHKSSVSIWALPKRLSIGCRCVQSGDRTRGG